MTWRKWQVWLEYGGLVLLVMLPMLRPGYILTLDLVFTPSLRLPAQVTSSYVFNATLHYLNFVIPSQVIEKLLLFGTLLLAGVGMHLLVRMVDPLVKPEDDKKRNASDGVAGYFGGILYMINPFTYERFIDGQYGVLMGYALLPWLLRHLFKLFAKQPPDTHWSLRPLAVWTLKLVGWLLVISMVSIHAIGMAGLLVLVAAGVAIRQGYKKAIRWQLVVALVAALGLWAVFSSYWLVPMVQGKTAQAQLIKGFDERHLLSFRTEGGTVGVPLNTLALYGYWGEREDRFVLPKEQLPAWPLPAVLIGGLVVVGALCGWRRHRGETITLLTIAAVAWIFAMGIAWPPVAGLNRWLYSHVPWFAGYREPQKFVALLALAYAYLGSLGITWLTRKAKPSGQAAIGLLVLVPIIYTPTMLWGLSGQLTPRQYPSDWYAVNRQLNADTQSFKVLFLPWHQYMSFNFAGRIISNPAKSYFDKPVLAGDNAEIGLIGRQASNPTSDSIERVLAQGGQITNAGAGLSSQNIKYLVLAKELDYHDYAWLDQQSDLDLMSDGPTLRVYKNRAWRPK